MKKKNYIVAIDMGSSHVVAAAGSRGADGRVEIEAISLKPSSGVVRGELKNVEQAAAAIKEAVAELEQTLGSRVTDAYMGIPGYNIRCAKHPYYVHVASEDGEISDQDVQRLSDSMRAVRAPERYTMLHIIPQHYLVDSNEEVAEPVGMFGKTLGSTFNLIMAKSVVLARLRKVLDKVGIAVAGYFVNPLAAAESVVVQEEKEVGVAVVDLGAGTTDITIYHDGVVRYVKVIPLGTDAINKDIRSYGIPERYVEEMKVRFGSAISSTADNEKVVKVPGRTPSEFKQITFHNLAQIIEARLTDISEYVVSEIKASGYHGRLQAGIVLTGGGAQIADVKQFFEQKTGLEVRIGAPNMTLSQSEEEAGVSAGDTRLAAVVGILDAGLDLIGEVAAPANAASRNRSQHGELDGGSLAGDKMHGEGVTLNDAYAQDSFAIDDSDMDTAPKSSRAPKEKSKKGGFFKRLKSKIEETLDMDVIGDDTTKI